jgi:hypothetical protein
MVASKVGVKGKCYVTGWRRSPCEPLESLKKQIRSVTAR